MSVPRAMGPILLFAVLGLPGCGDPHPRLPLDRPNVVVLFCDDAGYGDLGFTGNREIRTPHIDRMREEGVWFTQYASASSACTASRYSLLTGRHHRRAGFGWVLYPESPASLGADEVTVAEALKEQGYRTAMFGKWHLGYPNEKNGHDPSTLPLAHGFERWLGLAYSNDMQPPKWPPLLLLEGPDGASATSIPGYRVVAEDPDQSTLTKRYTDAAIAFIQAHRDQPFFVYVAYAMPHVPLHPGADHAGRSPRGAYGDVIEEIDGSVGRILDALRAQGIDRNTLVHFTSDNGPWIVKGRDGGSAGPFRDGKGSTWEGGHRVPGLFWWPGTVRRGLTSDEVVTTLDLFPTLVRLAGGESHANGTLDGRDVGPLLLGGEAPHAPPLFYGGPGRSAVQAVRVGRWKLHVRTNSQTGSDYGWPGVSRASPLLFDLEEDPGETTDLASEHLDVVSELLSTIDQFEANVQEETR